MISIEEFHVKYGRLPTEIDYDWKRELTVGEISLLEAPILSPGVCSVCGASQKDGRKYLDLGRDLEITVQYSYTIYLCTLCLKQLAVKAGILDPPVATSSMLTRKLTEVAISVNDLVDSVEELKELFNVDSDNSPISSSDSAVNSSDGAESEIESNNSRTVEAKQPTSKSATGRRSASVPELNDILLGNDDESGLISFK